MVVTNELDHIDRVARSERLARDILVRDLMQSRFLAALFATTTKREMALKGGLAMRAATGSTRFTKDVDLQTGPEVPMERVRSLVEGAIKACLGAGIIENVVISAPKQTDTVQRWKLNGTIAGGGSNVHMTVEVSRRGLPEPANLATVTYAPAYGGGKKAILVESYSPSTLAAAKIDALLSPNRIAVRDLFDLYRLTIEMRVDPPTKLLAKLGKDALAEALVELWPKLEQMTWELAKTELIPNLPKAVADGIDELEWDSMRMRTEEAVRGWLHKAMEACDEGLPQCR